MDMNTKMESKQEYTWDGEVLLGWYAIIKDSKGDFYAILMKPYELPDEEWKIRIQKMVDLLNKDCAS